MRKSGTLGITLDHAPTVIVAMDWVGLYFLGDARPSLPDSCVGHSVVISCIRQRFRSTQIVAYRKRGSALAASQSCSNSDVFVLSLMVN